MVSFCLTLLALVLRPQVAPSSPADFWKNLRAPGAKIERDRDDHNGLVTFGGLTYVINLGITPPKDRVDGGDIGVVFVPSPNISSTLLNEWIGDRIGWSGKVDLDGTVRIYASFPYMPPIADRCTEFLHAVSQFAEEFDAKPTANAAEVGEGKKVDCVSQADMFKLAKQWGWEHDGPWGVSSATWATPMNVQGQLVFVLPAFPGKSEPWRLIFEAMVKRPAGVDDKVWKDYSDKGRDGITQVRVNDSSIQFSKSLDMRGGVTLRSIKRSIESFAKQVKLKGKVTEPTPRRGSWHGLATWLPHPRIFLRPLQTMTRE